MVVNFQKLPVIPQVLYVTYSKYEKDWGSVMHSHAFTEFIYIENGNGEICTLDQSYPVSRGDFVILPPNLMHTEKSSTVNYLEYFVLGVSNLSFTNYNEANPSSYCPVFDLGNLNDRIHQILKDLWHEAQNARSGYEMMVASLYLQFNVLLQRRMKATAEYAESSNMRREIAYIKNYIDRHYMENLSLDEISSLANISKFHMVREFSRYMGISPMAYLTERRINEAKILLSSTNVSILDIANDTGFSSPSYFTQRFKSSTGKTPLQYRQDEYKVPATKERMQTKLGAL